MELHKGSLQKWWHHSATR